MHFLGFRVWEEVKELRLMTPSLTDLTLNVQRAGKGNEYGSKSRSNNRASGGQTPSMEKSNFSL
jgi:hypothetical protein